MWKMIFQTCSSAYNLLSVSAHIVAPAKSLCRTWTSYNNAMETTYILLLFLAIRRRTYSNSWKHMAANIMLLPAVRAHSYCVYAARITFPTHVFSLKKHAFGMATRCLQNNNSRSILICFVLKTNRSDIEISIHSLTVVRLYSARLE